MRDSCSSGLPTRAQIAPHGFAAPSLQCGKEGVIYFPTTSSLAMSAMSGSPEESALIFHASRPQPLTSVIRPMPYVSCRTVMPST